MERDRVREEKQEMKLLLKKIIQRELLHMKKMNSKEIQIRTTKQEKRLMAKIMKSKVMQKRSGTHWRNEKRIMVAKKAIERYNCDPKYRFLHNQIFNLFAELLKADFEYVLDFRAANKNQFGFKMVPFSLLFL